MLRNLFGSCASAVRIACRVGADVTNAQSRRGAASSVSETSQVQRSVDAVAASTGQRAAAVTVAQNLTPVSAAQAAFVQKQAVPAVISEPPTPQTTVSGVLTAVGVNPLSDSGPGAPVESPALVALFAGWRRLSEQGLTDETKTVRSQPVLTSQSEDGDGLAFAAETAALMASAAPVTIAAQTGNSPAGVVVSPAPNDPRIYVANTGSNTVSVFNTATGQPIDTNPNVAGTQSISVGSSPSALAISGTRLYVANTGSNTVSVIDTTTYNRIDANPSIFSMDIAVGSSPSALAISGTRLYVANRGGNTVSVIDTATNKVIDANPSIFSMNIAVGSSPSALAISGTRLYVANRGGNTVSVINTATNSVTNTITVESQPSSVAVSTDGTRVYVANTGTGTVSVINFNATTNTYNLVDTNPNIAGTQSFFVGSAPSSVAVSQDGRLAYAALSSDMVAVIDTSSNVVSLAQIDAAAELGAHALALGPDGRVYVTDGADRVLRSLSLVDGALVTIGRSTLVLPNSNGYAVPASWYFPNHDDAPIGLIYLQHGGYRTDSNMSALAQQLADRTNSIVVTPTVPTNPFDRYDIGNDPIERAVAALFVGDRSALTASAAAAAGHPVTLPQQVVLAGHSYGGNLVAATAGYIADAGGAGNLKGVILFDPVHDGDGQTGMAKLKGANAVPVMSISAPPCFCSGYGANTTTTINSAPDKFVGIMLVGGSAPRRRGCQHRFGRHSGLWAGPDTAERRRGTDHHSRLDQ